MWKFVQTLLAEPKPRSLSTTRFKPKLENLEDRTVPTVLDLTTAGATASANGALFQQASPQPTGSGFIHSFVRLDSPGNTSTEQGYNTDARPLQFDENNSPVFTRSLQLSQVPVVTVNGVAYREFLLDINQKQSSPELSLDQLRIYVGNSGNLTGYDPTTNQLAGMTPVYDLGAGNVVLLNSALSHGSGSGDMQLLVPDAQLTAAAGNFIYLYSSFGATIPTNGGFEEWAVQSSTASASVSGTVFYDTNMNGVLDAGETGINDVLVTLNGQTATGQQVTAQAWSGMNASGQAGFYIFSGLPAGSYSITETVPGAYTPTSPTTLFAGLVTDQILRDQNFGLVLAPINS
jgi:SdrD B-like domain